MHLAMMKRCAMLLIAIFGFTAFSLAQTVTGTVTDKKGDPLPGVTVTVKGTKNATSSNAQGVYTLNNVGADAVLVFTGAGVTKQEIAVAGKSSVSTSLDASVSNLNEVVVVGYGTRKVKDATGSVASLSTKDFNKGQISTPEQLLQGRTPGVVITSASGEPGAAATINIRGSASIRGNQEPLYVVDGVPISGGGTSGSASGIEGSSSPKNPLMFLNPNDIESISILKDASSAAIYGSRGANGVIIITTKGGKGNKGSFQFSASTSIASVAKKYDLLTASDFISSIKDIKKKAGLSDADIADQLKTINKGANTDWQDEIFRTAISQNYNLGWGIGRKSTNVRLSGSYDKQQGTIKKTGLTRLTGKLNFTQKFLNDKLRFDLNSTVSNVKNQYPPLTNNAGYQGSLIGAAITFNPTYPISTGNGFYDPGDGNRNPVQMLTYFNDNDNITRYLNNLSGTVELVSGLTYKATLGYDRSIGERLSFADPRLTSAYGGTNNIFGKDLQNPITNNGRGFKQNVSIKSVLVEHTLNYDKTFNDKHNVKGLLGYSYQTTESQYNGYIGWGLTKTNATNPFMGPYNELPNNSFNQYDNYYSDVPSFTKSDLQSYFGRVEYSFEDKYYLTGTVRIDGSSKFGKDNKYGTFPAFAAKWRLIKEAFAANSLGRIFSDISIRANYGILGSQDGLGAYDAINQQRTYFDNNGNIATQLIHQGNTKLKWEQATTSGVGIDFALANNKLSGTVDYYSTKRKDILFFGPVPGGFSATSYYFSNLPGFVLNKGLEVSLNYNVIKTKNFSWSVNYNMTFLKNEVKDMNVTVNTGAVSGQGLTGAYAQTIKDGYPLFTWKMPVFNGFDKDGYAIYADGGKDQILGSALPTFLAGLTNNFTYGRLSASVFVNATTGFYIYNNTANAVLLKGSLNTAHNVDYATANTNESVINPGSVSTRFLEKGDFVRIANATLSYSFDVKSKALKSLSAYVSGQNLALFTGYSGLDPEVNVDKNINGYPSRGFDYAGYPKARTFTVGVNLGF